MVKRAGYWASSDLKGNHSDSSLGGIVEKYGLDHAWEDLGHVNAHNLWDHLWKVDPRLQGLGLDEQIIGELVQLPHNLWMRERETETEIRHRVINNKDDTL